MLLTTREVAVELGLSIRRVQAMIKSGRLRAREIGPVYVVDHKDLEAVRVRKPGRPRTSAKKAKKKATA